MTLTYQAIESAKDEWLDNGSSGYHSASLYGNKWNPPTPSQPPPRDDSLIRGTDGDDTLLGTAGDHRIYGGKGEDTVVYSGALAEYVLTAVPGDGYELTDQVRVRDGHDHLTWVERLQFADVTVLLDGQGGARLEDGTVLLAPDAVGIAIDWPLPSGHA